MIRILVDSAADFSKEELAEKNIEMVPLIITVNDNTFYRDEIDLSRKDLYRLLTTSGNTVKTSQPSPESFLEKFKAIKESGDEVICITLSSALSGTYQSAVMAKELAEYDRIHIIDSLSGTVGIQILVEYALKLIQKGCSANEIVNKIENLKSHIRITAVVDTLKYLYLGGRISKTTAIVAEAVTLKPSIVITPEGTVGMSKKYIGIRRAVKDLTAQMKSANIDPDFPLYIIYSENRDNAALLQDSLTEAGIPISKVCEIGATIGVHAGPGIFGTVYIEK